jgi:hypothetical protein
VLSDSTADGCWEPNLEHALHDAIRVVSDLVIGEGARTDDALQDASAPVCTGAIPKVIFESVVETGLLSLHAFLISFASSSSAGIEGALMPSLTSRQIRCLRKGRPEEPRLLMSEGAYSGTVVVSDAPLRRYAQNA